MRKCTLVQSTAAYFSSSFSFSLKTQLVLSCTIWMFALMWNSNVVKAFEFLVETLYLWIQALQCYDIKGVPTRNLLSWSQFFFLKTFTSCGGKFNGSHHRRCPPKFKFSQFALHLGGSHLTLINHLSFDHVPWSLHNGMVTLVTQELNGVGWNGMKKFSTFHGEHRIGEL